jgi:hypothetical protein
MLEIFRGRRPDATAAQVAAVLVAGVPVIATLLSALGIVDVSASQQDALANALTWAVVFAGLLIGGDATLRTARNVVDAKRDVAAMVAGSAGGGAPPSTPAALDDPEVDELEPNVVVTDDEEYHGDDEVASVNGHGDFDDPDRPRVVT